MLPLFLIYNNVLIILFGLFSRMNRKGRKGPQMQNPLAGMMDVPGGIPAGGFLGIGNPNGAQINFNNDELEDELADLLGKFHFSRFY